MGVLPVALLASFVTGNAVCWCPNPPCDAASCCVCLCCAPQLVAGQTGQSGCENECRTACLHECSKREFGKLQHYKRCSLHSYIRPWCSVVEGSICMAAVWLKGG